MSHVNCISYSRSKISVLFIASQCFAILILTAASKQNANSKSLEFIQSFMEHLRISIWFSGKQWSAIWAVLYNAELYNVSSTLIIVIMVNLIKFAGCQIWMGLCFEELVCLSIWQMYMPPIHCKFVGGWYMTFSASAVMGLSNIYTGFRRIRGLHLWSMRGNVNACLLQQSVSERLKPRSCTGIVVLYLGLASVCSVLFNKETERSSLWKNPILSS